MNTDENIITMKDILINNVDDIINKYLNTINNNSKVYAILNKEKDDLINENKELLKIQSGLKKTINDYEIIINNLNNKL